MDEMEIFARLENLSNIGILDKYSFSTRRVSTCEHLTPDIRQLPIKIFGNEFVLCLFCLDRLIDFLEFLDASRSE